MLYVICQFIKIKEYFKKKKIPNLKNCTRVSELNVNFK